MGYKLDSRLRGNDDECVLKLTNFSYVPKTMRPSQSLESKRDAVRAAAVRFRTAYPRVFGSVARGADVDGSDLDLLVDALPARLCSILGGPQVELEALLGVPVMWSHWVICR